MLLISFYFKKDIRQGSALTVVLLLTKVRDGMFYNVGGWAGVIWERVTKKISTLGEGSSIYFLILREGDAQSKQVHGICGLIYQY